MVSLTARLIIRNMEGEYLFLLQTKRNGNKYSLVGGTVDGKEYAKEALIRETAEEIGIKIRSEELKLLHTMHRFRDKNDPGEIILYFEAKRYFGVPISKEPKKFLRVEWLDPEDLPFNMSVVTRRAIQHILEGKKYAEFADEPLAQLVKKLRLGK